MVRSRSSVQSRPSAPELEIEVLKRPKSGTNGSVLQKQYADAIFVLGHTIDSTKEERNGTMNVLERDDHLLKTKLVLKSTDDFTDKQALKVFLGTELRSEDDISELVEYLKICRPALFTKLSACFKTS